MGTSKPPPTLPETYREVWRALREADDRARSRADLARELGISTHTIQRILVDGAVPDFRRHQSRRLRLSWARTLARVARRLGREPRDWLESVGIGWDRDARTASEAAAKGERAPAQEAERPLGRLERVRARAAIGDPAPVTAGLASRSPFSDPCGREASFLEEYARRLIQAVDPSWSVRWQRGAPADLIDELLRRDSSLDVAVGLFETAHLRSRGVDFIPVPGWNVEFRALAVRRRSVDGLRLEWGRIGDLPDLRFIVQDGDPSGPFVRRHWDVPTSRVLVRRRSSAEAVAEEVLREAARRPREALLLFADAETVRTVADRLDVADGFREDFEMETLAAPAGEEPRYPLGIAVPAENGEWSALLDHARREELFGAARASVAGLYADFLVAGVRGMAGSTEPIPAADAGLLRPVHFEQAEAGFQRAFIRRLLASLAEAAARGRTTGDAWDRAIRLGHALTPKEWRGALQEEARIGKRAAVENAGEALRPLHAFCNSCSASLLENRGASDLYCRYCSDENGRLRPREEVHRILSEWMQGWQGDLSEERAGERAERLMSAMPAWSNN